MVKRYWFIILVYLFSQLSGLFGYKLLLNVGVAKDQVVGLWTIISFTLGLVVILLLLIPDMKLRHLDRDRSTPSQAILWSVLGVFMALFAQAIAGIIESNLLGIEPGSENTEVLITIAKATPAFILVTSIVGPILEEIIFRKIIFGTLYQRFNFWASAIISSLVFATVHFDFPHLLIYTAMGLTFSFLYVKTKRIIVPIVAHVAMNTLVVVVNILFEDQIKNLQEQAGLIHFFNMIFGIS